MTPEQYHLAQRFAERAEDLDPASRDALLVEAQQQDPVVGDLLVEWLSELPPDDFLEQGHGLGSVSGLLDEAPLEDLVGSKLGRYRLEERRGEGGFGVVYRATQTEPVVRDVAVKVIKLGMDTRRVIARFEAERQSLALMEHPGIARVLDAGATETGRPYFVMELVRGCPVTEFCRRERLDVAQRLRLFREVCDAVQHAHAKGVIHRDLKPSNVLVDTSGEQPRVKVIDFGIAKAVGEADLSMSLQTVTGQLVGTPAYMSPEQASGGVETLDTRSDVYALGVLLYELLAGTTPFDNGALQASTPQEACRVIREQEPKRPSTRLGEHRAEGRGRIPASLSVDRELDWIVLKALEKDRERRYASAAALADDVARYERHEPVEASPPSTAYRLRKWVRRNRGLFAAGVAVASVLVLGIVGTGIGLVQAEDALEVAERERVAAVEERDKAQAVTEFFRDMILEANPEQNKGQAPSLLEVLERAAAGLDEDTQLRDQPATEALLRMTIGRTYADLGELEKAQAHFEAALALWTDLHGLQHKDTAWALERLAENYWDRGLLEDAERLMRQAIPQLVRHFGDDSEEVGSARNDLGNILADRGQLEEAQELLAASYATSVRLEGEEGRSALHTLNNLGTILADLGRYEEAADVHRKSVDVRARVFGNPSRELGTAYNNLGFALFSLGQERGDEALVEEGIEQYHEALRIKREVFGETHQDIGYSYLSLASVELKRGGMEACLAHAERAVECFEASGVEGWQVGLALSFQAYVQIDRGEIEVGCSLGERGYDKLVASLGADNERTRRHAQAMADRLRDAGQAETAARWAARAGGD